MININSLVEGAHKIEPLPQTIQQLCELLPEHNVSVSKIEDILNQDVPLTARLLRLANSAAFGNQKTVGTVRSAIVRMGYGNIFALAMACNTEKHMTQALPEYGLPEGALWEHAQAARLAVAEIRKHSDIEIPPEAAICALLHDIGKVVMARHMQPDALRLIRQACDNKPLELQLEKEILQVHHGELGGLIMQHWNLPEMIVRGVIYHHDPQLCENEDNTICHITCMANWIGHLACEPESKPPGKPPPSAQFLGLDAEDIKEAVLAVRDQIRLMSQNH